VRDSVVAWVLGAVAATAVAVAADGAGATRLQGQALLGRNRPAVGVSVAIHSEDGAGILYLTSTDARGVLKAVDLPDGTYRVDFRKYGFAPVSKEGVVVRPALRPVLEVRLTPAGEAAAGPAGGDAREGGAVEVRGRVVDPAGSAVPDVRVRVVRGDGGDDPKTARTDADGAFAFASLTPGAWNVEVIGVGFLPIRTPVDIDGPLRVTVRAVPQPADYLAAPIDLMPPEVPIPPPGSTAGG